MLHFAAMARTHAMAHAAKKKAAMAKLAKKHLTKVHKQSTHQPLSIPFACLQNIEDVYVYVEFPPPS